MTVPTFKLPDEVIAFSRASVESMFRDTAIIYRKWTRAVTEAAPAGGDGRGGASSAGVPNAINSFVPDELPIQCRLEYVPAMKGGSEGEVADSIQEKTLAVVALPSSTIILDSDRIQITTRHDGDTKMWEVVSQSPHTDQLVMRVAVALVGSQKH